MLQQQSSFEASPQVDGGFISWHFLAGKAEERASVLEAEGRGFEDNLLLQVLTNRPVARAEPHRRPVVLPRGREVAGSVEEDCEAEKGRGVELIGFDASLETLNGLVALVQRGVNLADVFKSDMIVRVYFESFIQGP
jgi:hypothetical protein